MEVANQTLLKVHGSIERLPGATAARREIVGTTLAWLDRLNKETGNDKRILAAMASAYIRLARIEGDPLQPNLGDYRGTDQTFRKAAKILDDLIAAVELREQVFALNPNDVVVERDLMMSYGHIGDLLGSPFLFNLGDTSGALANYRKAASIAESMVSADPSNRQAKVDLGIVLGRIGSVLSTPAEIPESLATFARSADILEKLVAATPGDVNSATQLAVIYEYQGRRQRALKDYRAALERYRKSSEVCEPIVKARPTSQSLTAWNTVPPDMRNQYVKEQQNLREQIAACKREAEKLRNRNSTG